MNIIPETIEPTFLRFGPYKHEFTVFFLISNKQNRIKFNKYLYLMVLDDLNLKNGFKVCFFWEGGVSSNNISKL